MIDVVLKFLRDDLNTSLKGAASAGGEPPIVVFPAGDKIGDSVAFALGHVSLLLVRLEEENMMRSADPYARTAPNGTRQRVHPEIHLNLHVLFVPHFADYALSLRWLSQVVGYYQNHRVFTPANYTALSPDVVQLTAELVTLPSGEQNEVWGALRTSYRPSALYRVRMAVFRDGAAETQPVVEDVRVHLQP